jgi:hypothetical protein
VFIPVNGQSNPEIEAFPDWEMRLEKNMTIFPALWGETRLTKIFIVFFCIITVI